MEPDRRGDGRHMRLNNDRIEGCQDYGVRTEALLDTPLKVSVVVSPRGVDQSALERVAADDRGRDDSANEDDSPTHAPSATRIEYLRGRLGLHRFRVAVNHHSTSSQARTGPRLHGYCSCISFEYSATSQPSLE